VFSHAPAPPSSSGEAAAEPTYSWTTAPMIIAAAILCVPLFAVMYVNYVRSPANATALSLPAGAGSWEGAGPAVDTGWNPVFPEASATARGSYRSSAGTVEVFTARYETQRQGAELINFSNSLLGEGWQAYDHGGLTEEHPSPLVSDIRTIRGHTGGTVRILVSYVYRVGPVVTSSDAFAQLSYGLLSWTQERPAAVVAVAMRCVHLCTTERETLTAFWSEFGAKLIEDAHPTPRKL
jgi:EpsI family protein